MCSEYKRRRSASGQPTAVSSGSETPDEVGNILHQPLQSGLAAQFRGLLPQIELQRLQVLRIVFVGEGSQIAAVF